MSGFKALRGVGAAVFVALVLAMIATVAFAASSLASPPTPTVTVSGSVTDARSPDSDDHNASVSATLSNGIASGSLQTSFRLNTSRSFSRYVHFAGNVTCMDIDGNRVTVGAFGTDEISGLFQEPEEPFELPPGTYAQVLTVEFGEFPLIGTFPQRFVTDSFGMLGEHGEGLPSDTPPNCNRRYSFANQILPFRGAIHISPSITSPKDGYVSHTGTVKLSGTGEPNRAITVYEVGHQASGTEVVANAKGKWSLTLSGLAVGTHVFTASAVNGSAIPANTVEVKVVS
jgi:hypothetical protein